MIIKRSGLAPILAAVALLPFLPGCSGSAARCPVQGEVRLGTQPVAEAVVVFHPQFEVPPGDPKPMGITDASGAFQLTSLHANDGALPGDYRVTIEQRQERASGEDVVRDGPNLLPARYAKPDTTPLHFTVTSRSEAALLVMEP